MSTLNILCVLCTCPVWGCPIWEVDSLFPGLAGGRHFRRTHFWRPPAGVLAAEGAQWGLIRTRSAGRQIGEQRRTCLLLQSSPCPPGAQLRGPRSEGEEGGEEGGDRRLQKGGVENLLPCSSAAPDSFLPEAVGDSCLVARSGGGKGLKVQMTELNEVPSRETCHLEPQHVTLPPRASCTARELQVETSQGWLSGSQSAAPLTVRISGMPSSLPAECGSQTGAWVLGWGDPVRSLPVSAMLAFQRRASAWHWGLGALGHLPEHSSSPSIPASKELPPC